MGLIDIINKDIKRFTTDLNGYGSEITISTHDGNTVLETVGIHVKHHVNVDSDGNVVNSKNAKVSISEDNFIQANYPYRNSGGEVNLYNHLVSAKDSTGLVKNYVIREFYADEYIGLIVCILGDYDSID